MGRNVKDADVAGVPFFSFLPFPLLPLMPATQARWGEGQGAA